MKKMITRLFDRDTGQRKERGDEDVFGAFSDEVLNAGWIPPRPALQLGLAQVQTLRPSRQREMDVDAFVAAMYCCQQ